MGLQDELKEDLKEALRQRRGAEIISLRLVLAGVKVEEKKEGTTADDAVVLDVVRREAKRHRESIDAFTKASRQDLVFKEEAELAVLLKYLPQQMSRGEIVAAARQAITQVEARGPSDKGKVMAQLMKQLKNKAEGQEVSNVVSELLAELSSHAS